MLIRFNIIKGSKIGCVGNININVHSPTTSNFSQVNFLKSRDEVSCVCASVKKVIHVQSHRRQNPCNSLKALFLLFHDNLKVQCFLGFGTMFCCSFLALVLSENNVRRPLQIVQVAP